MRKARSRARLKNKKRRAARRARDQWPVRYPGKKPRLYLDASVPESFVDILSQRQVDAVHATAAGLAHRDDIDHWDEARKEHRHLVTADNDFWDDRAYPLHKSPGTIVLDTGAKQESSRARTLLLGFLPRLKALVRAPDGGELLRRTKIRLTGQRIASRTRDRDSRIVTRDEEWGPWW